MSPAIEIFRSAGASSARWNWQTDDPHTAPLRVTTECSGSAVIIATDGEVDASNENAWEYLLGKMAAVATAPGPFVIDVRNLRFMGCCAFPVLAPEAQRCRRRGINLCLISNQPIVARAVAASGLRPVLPIYPTVEAALSRATTEPCGRGLTLRR